MAKCPVSKDIYLYVFKNKILGAKKLPGSGGTEQHAAQGMRVGPSESVDRGRLQTTSQRITLNGVYGKPAKKRRLLVVIRYFI